MQGFGLLGSVISGALAGWIAEKLMGARHGLLRNIILGIVGALVGNFLAQALLQTTFPGVIGQMATGALGACLLIALGRGLRR